ncbi:MAG: hypothetical protein NVV59_19695 [Chitinophagaceae bacterium]|nr:hypothetical protein [Chitinophagaceae bacterium]
MNRFCWTLIAGFFLSFSASAQDIEDNLTKYALEYAQERVHIHFDKAAYTPGDTIWYKVYTMEGPFPADASKTFYLDWTDEKGKLISRNVSPLYEGTTNGQFVVPDNFTGQYVHARGYTRWMLNFDSSFLYNKDIRVLQKTTAKGAPVQDTYTLNFFPEGGDIIKGLVNKVAFKAHDQFGNPIVVKGNLLNQQGKVIDSVRSIHDGMGLIFVTPQAGESFKVKWKDPKGKEHETALPAVKTHGIGLQVSVVRDRRYFQVNVGRDNQFDPGILHVVGTLGGSQVFLISKDSRTSEVKGVIPSNQLPSGILTITVFDDQWRPMAERITMINNPETIFKPEVEVKHWGLNKRARNDIEIAIPDSLVSNLSVSITDASIAGDSTDNIISRLLLTGDLKGNVYKPGYYFSNDSDSTARHLDLVMLTHGWRKIKWEELVKGVMPKIQFPRDTSYLTLSGRVYGASSAELRETGEILLVVKQKDQEGGIVVVPVKPDGTFNDGQTLLYDSATIYHQFQGKNKLAGATVRYLENKLPPLPSTVAATGRYSTLGADTTGFARQAQISAEEAAFLKQFEGKTLEAVVVKARTKTPIQEMDERYTSGLFSGGDGYQFDLVNDPLAAAQMNIFTYLQGKVAGLQVQGAVSSTPTLTWRGGTPQLYLNEIATDVEMVSSVSVADVAYIKVFRPPFMGGFNGGNGAIAIYTRRGGDTKSEPGKGLSSSVITGYSEIRQFYSPNYSTFKPEHEKKDMRTTLYWNPLILTSPGRSRLQFSFYNNDITEAFRIVIEGMTRDGRLTRYEEILY